MPIFGRLAQLARAALLHSEGRGFESLIAHTTIYTQFFWYNYKMTYLTETADSYKRLADDFFVSSGLLEVLKKHGEVVFAGAYEANLMMHGDIDMRLVREQDYSLEEVVKIFDDIYLSTVTSFRSYFIYGDWDDDRKGNGYPHGRYVGMKAMIAGEKWKFDIWFVSTSELARMQQEQFDVNKYELTPQQRESILEFKKYRNENSILITGQQIYQMVLEQGIITLQDFKAQIVS
jgi:hypothetical protein